MLRPEQVIYFQKALKEYVKVHELPGCCGVEVIASFNHIPMAYFREAPEMLEEHIHSLYIQREKEGYKEPAIRIIALAGWQSFLEDIFLKDGFKPLTSGRNMKTMSHIHVYQKLLHPIEEAKSEAKIRA